MSAILNHSSDVFLDKLRFVFDLTANTLDNVIKRLGPQGYYFYGILSNTFFFFASLVIKLFPQVDWTICLIIRGIVTFIGSYLISYTYKKTLYFEGDELKYIFVRNFFISIQQLFFYYVILVIPLNITWIVNNTGPIFVFIIGYFMLGTQLTKRDILFLMVSVLGINIITAPQLVMNLFSAILPFDTDDISSGMDSYQMLISLLFFASLTLWAFGIAVVRLCKTASSLSINNNLGIQLIVFGSVALFVKSDTVTIPPITDLLFVFTLLGIPTFISQILFIHGTLIAEDQGKFSLTNYIPVFYSYIYQIMFQKRTPKALELVGVFLTFYGLYKVVVKPKPTIQDERKQSLLTERDISEMITYEKSEEHEHVKKPNGV